MRVQVEPTQAPALVLVGTNIFFRQASEARANMIASDSHSPRRREFVGQTIDCFTIQFAVCSPLITAGCPISAASLRRAPSSTVYLIPMDPWTPWSTEIDRRGSSLVINTFKVHGFYDGESTASSTRESVDLFWEPCPTVTATLSKASRHSPDHLWNVDLAKSFPNVPRAWSSVASGLHHSPNCCRLRTRGFMAFAAVKDSASITVSTP